MTDDEALVARLRAITTQALWLEDVLDADRAADRIEALSKQLDKARAQVKTMEAENEVRLPLIARLQAEMGERGVRMQQDAREFNALETKLQAIEELASRPRTLAEQMSRDFDGNLFPQIVMADEILAILEGKETS